MTPRPDDEMEAPKYCLQCDGEHVGPWCPTRPNPAPPQVSESDENLALMYRGDCYKGNATNPDVRESYADQGYMGFLAGLAKGRESAERSGKKAPKIVGCKYGERDCEIANFICGRCLSDIERDSKRERDLREIEGMD